MRQQTGAGGQTQPRRLFVALWSLLLVAIALVWNAPLLAPGRHGIFDWQKEIYFLHFFHDAITEYHTLPLSFLRFPGPIVDYPVAYTASYWANPEVPTLAPLALFSLFLPTLAAFKLVVALHLAVGALGIGLLARKIGLGAVGTLALLLCTLLNPWLAHHIAIGYTPWMSACLIPPILVLLGRPTLTALAGASLLDALILYQGGLHVFVWFNATLVATALLRAAFQRQLALLRRPFALLALTAALVMSKVWAVAVAYRGMKRAVARSYSSLAHLWGLLTDDRSDLLKFPDAFDLHGTNFYDASTFMGVWFLVLLLLACALLLRRSRSQGVARVSTQLACLLTAILCVALGWQGVWATIVRAVPILHIELYPYRFLFVAVFLSGVFVVVEFHHLTSRLPGWKREMALLIAFVPILVALGSRHQLMTELASARRDQLDTFSLKTVLARAITATQEDGTPLPVTATPSGVTVALGSYSGPIRLPWFYSKTQLESFTLMGAQEAGLAFGVGLRLIPQPCQARVELRAKDYGCWPLAGLGLALWFGMIGLGHVSRGKKAGFRPPQAHSRPLVPGAGPAQHS